MLPARRLCAMPACPFCQIPPADVLLSEGPCLCIYDRYPVADGHVLIIPRRHFSSALEMTAQEWLAVFALLKTARTHLQRADTRIAGFNIGINEGRAAGQTVFHVHVHLIPRREGDRQRPDGGVRWIFPEKATYRQREA